MVFPSLTLPLGQDKIGGRETTESVKKRNFSVILDEEPATTFKCRACKETQLPRQLVLNLTLRMLYIALQVN